ncbi:MAG: TatD family hydrolase [Culturomica sp.]|nr:TatD family hydrolase [Culturomica sp.]
MEYIDVHTHRSSQGLHILDVSNGQQSLNDERISYGIHPLFIEADSLERLKKVVSTVHLSAIGEAGLDRNSEAGIDLQIAIFEEEIKISEQLGVPVIIHCVRAFPELISVHKRMKPKQAWIVHGYNNNQYILKQLLDTGMYLSAGKALFHPASNIVKLLKGIPLDRLFLETDDSVFRIEEVYTEALKILDITLEALIEQIYINFEKCFRNGK